MIISSEHHDLIEEFQRANEIEGEIIKALSSYMTTPGCDRARINELSQKMEEAHKAKMILWGKLEAVNLEKR